MPVRPKVEKPNQNYIYIKFNEEIFRYAQHLESNGILVFAGAPCVSSILDINPLDYVFFKINTNINLIAPIFVQMKLGSHTIIGLERFKGISAPLAENELLKIIETSSSLMTWCDAIDVIRGLGKAENRLKFSRFFWTMTYKPIYLLLWE